MLPGHGEAARRTPPDKVGKIEVTTADRMRAAKATSSGAANIEKAIADARKATAEAVARQTGAGQPSESAASEIEKLGRGKIKVVSTGTPEPAKPAAQAPSTPASEIEKLSRGKVTIIE